MLFLKIAVIVVVYLLAVALGGQAVAWRRACVFIAKSAYGIWSVRDLSQQAIIRFTPKFVSHRSLSAIFLWMLSGFLSFIFFRWYIAVGVLVATFISRALYAFALPKPEDPYYLNRVHQSFTASRDRYRRFEDRAADKEMQARLNLLERVCVPVTPPVTPEK